MADRNIEVRIEEVSGEKGNSFRTAQVFENERIVANIAVPNDASPEDISASFRYGAETAGSKESRDLLNQASKLVPGLEKR